ncbi:hypothetical protein Pelo_4354 [Pelomyxa schiedti]|nr:hypothetical protein Pelo_4354 [Pelomyxa schiedti]
MASTGTPVEQVLGRRSVRGFDATRTLTSEVLDQLVAAAVNAPTARNQQHFRLLMDITTTTTSSASSASASASASAYASASATPPIPPCQIIRKAPSRSNLMKAQSAFAKAITRTIMNVDDPTAAFACVSDEDMRDVRAGYVAIMGRDDTCESLRGVFCELARMIAHGHGGGGGGAEGGACGAADEGATAAAVVAPAETVRAAAASCGGGASAMVASMRSRRVCKVVACGQDATAFLVGRQPKLCDLQACDDADDKVSRVHFILFVLPASREVVVVDPGCMNGFEVVSRSNLSAPLCRSSPTQRNVLKFAFQEDFSLRLSDSTTCMGSNDIVEFRWTTNCVNCTVEKRKTTLRKGHPACGHGLLLCENCIGALSHCPVCDSVWKDRTETTSTSTSTTVPTVEFLHDESL